MAGPRRVTRTLPELTTEASACLRRMADALHTDLSTALEDLDSSALVTHRAKTQEYWRCSGLRNYAEFFRGQADEMLCVGSATLESAEHKMKLLSDVSDAILTKLRAIHAHIKAKNGDSDVSMYELFHRGSFLWHYLGGRLEAIGDVVPYLKHPEWVDIYGTLDPIIAL